MFVAMIKYTPKKYEIPPLFYRLIYTLPQNTAQGTLDTPNNRKWMSDADTSTWTSLSFIAELFQKWTQGLDRPPSGSLVTFETVGGVTSVNAN